MKMDGCSMHTYCSTQGLKLGRGGKTWSNLQITNMPVAFLHLSSSLSIRQNIHIPGNNPSQSWPLHPPLSSCLLFASDSASLSHMYLAYNMFSLTFINSNRTSKITTILSFSFLLTIHSFHMVWMNSDIGSDCCLFLLLLCLISVSLFFFLMLYFISACLICTAANKSRAKLNNNKKDI